MFFKRSDVLYTLDTGTYVSVDTFQDSNEKCYGQNVEGIWTVFVHTCCKIYARILNIQRSKQGSIFISERWRQLKNLNCVKSRLLRAQAYSSLKIGKRSHNALRRIS